MNIHDRMISQAADLATPLARLRELAPRLVAALPDTVGGCAERLNATRREIEDAAEFAVEHVANRGGLLVARDARLAAWDRADDFYITRKSHD